MKPESIVRVGIGCWIFNPTGMVLLGKRISKHGYGTWAAPGGHLEFKETPVECASRELLEETGIFVPVDKFKYVGITNDIFPDKHYITIHYFTESVCETPHVQEPDKCETWRWFNFQDIPNNLFLPTKNFITQTNMFQFMNLSKIQRNQKN